MNPSPSTMPLHTVLLYNPIAGAGRAEAAARAIAALLERRRAPHSLIPTTAGGHNPPLQEALREAKCLVVIGGDGTIRSAAGFAIEADVPILQCPFGTENLFAREFGMTRRVDEVIAAIERGRTTSMDVGEVNGEQFLMMVSVGFDAEMIHDLASRRTGGISHLSYVGPFWRSFRSWRAQPVRITVDGERIDELQPGTTIIANAPQYAFRLDPVPQAKRDDGLLHIVHIPIARNIALPMLALKARLRRHLRSRGVFTAAGRSIELEGDEPQRVQIDGEATQAEVTDAPWRLKAIVRPQALRVLLPAK